MTLEAASLREAANWKRECEDNLNEVVIRRENRSRRYRTTKLSDLKERNFKEVQKDIAERRVVPRGMPWFVGLGIDTRCNLRCIMCVQRVSDISVPPIKKEFLLEFADQVFPTAKILQLNVGGEPLMSRTFELELELAEKYEIKLDVVTNGTLLNAKSGLLDRLVNASQSITISFDAPTKETYESIRIGSNFDTVVENMKCLQEIRRDMISRPVFYIAMVLMKRNLSELPAMVHFAKDVGADLLLLSRLVPFEGMQSESLDGSEKSVIIKSQAIANGLGLNMGVPGVNGMTQSKKHCFFLYERTYIDSLGRIIPCCNPEHPVAGSLAEYSFEEIWRGPIYQAMRQTFANGPSHELCQKCASSGYLAGI